MIPFLDPIVPYFPILAYGLVTLFVCLYGAFSSIEFGSALLLVSPWPVVDVTVVRRYLNPIWEATNVFLIFALVGTVMFFPAAIPAASVAVFPTMMTALIFFALRAMGILGLMYYGSVSEWFKYIFAIGSAGAPLLLSNVYVFILSGIAVVLPTTALASVMWFVVLVTLIFISISFFIYFAPKSPYHGDLRRVHVFSGAAYLLSSLLLSDLIPGISTLGVWVLNVLVFVLVVASLSLAEYERRLMSFVSAMLADIVLIAGLSALRYPYIAFPMVSASSVFTSPLMFEYMLLVVPFGLLITVPALIWFYSMYARAIR